MDKLLHCDICVLWDKSENKCGIKMVAKHFSGCTPIPYDYHKDWQS